MERIKEIDTELKNQFEALNEIIRSVRFTELVDFKLDEAAIQIPWNDIVYPGIYLIEIKNTGKYDSFNDWVENFQLEWEDEKYIKCFTPNLKKVRIRAHNELNDWMPLYIGKSKNIGSRIHEHIYKELDKTTFALKLMARSNLKNEIFRVQTLKVEVENYDAIVPRIEWQLRNRINPIIGKQ